MGPRSVASWSVAGVLCWCTVAALAAPVLLPEELMLEVAEVVVEETTPAVPPTADPKLTLDIPQIPNKITQTTLISSGVLLELGVLNTDSDESIELDGTTHEPPPQLTVDVLPGSVAEKEAIEATKAESTTPAIDKVDLKEKIEAD